MAAIRSPALNVEASSALCPLALYSYSALVCNQLSWVQQLPGDRAGHCLYLLCLLHILICVLVLHHCALALGLVLVLKVVLMEA